MINGYESILLPGVSSESGEYGVQTEGFRWEEVLVEVHVKRGETPKTNISHCL